MEREQVKNMFYASWFVIFTLGMCPGLSVFLFQIICIKLWKLRLTAELAWKIRIPSHEETLQFQNLVSLCVTMELQTFQNVFTKIDKMPNGKSVLLGCIMCRYLCFPNSGTSRAGTWASHQPRQSLVILGPSWVLSDMTSTGHSSFNTYHDEAAFRFCRSDEVFFSMAFIKTSTLTWTSCKFLEINIFLQNPLVLPNWSFLHQLLILFHKYLTVWINHL